MISERPAYEYRTTFTVVSPDFPNHSRIAEDLARVSPKPPKGRDWQLASSASGMTANGLVIFYFWERRGQDADAA